MNDVAKFDKTGFGPITAVLTITQENEDAPTSISVSYKPSVKDLGVTEVADLPDSYYLMGWTYATLNEYLQSLANKGALDGYKVHSESVN